MVKYLHVGPKVLGPDVLWVDLPDDPEDFLSELLGLGLLPQFDGAHDDDKAVGLAVVKFMGLQVLQVAIVGGEEGEEGCGGFLVEADADLDGIRQQYICDDGDVVRVSKGTAASELDKGLDAVHKGL